jgi:hypothetical protein
VTQLLYVCAHILSYSKLPQQDETYWKLCYSRYFYRYYR